jgi:hypothetical protein
MATYQELIAQGMTPNQAALQAQMAGPQAPPPTVGSGPLAPSAQPTPWKPTDTGSGLVGAPTIGGLPSAGPGQVMNGNQPSVPQATALSAPASPNAPRYGLEGFDANKRAAGHDSPKYQIGGVLERFDPKAGVTPEVLAALNALGIGTFTGDKDKIHVGGNIDPRFQDVTSFDVVRGFNGPGGGQAWQFGGLNGSAAAQTQPGVGMAGGGGMPSTLGIASLLSGDPLQRIQQAIGQINGKGQVNLDALLSQLQGV